MPPQAPPTSLLSRGVTPPPARQDVVIAPTGSSVRMSLLEKVDTLQSVTTQPRVSEPSSMLACSGKPTCVLSVVQKVELRNSIIGWGGGGVTKKNEKKNIVTESAKLAKWYTT